MIEDIRFTIILVSYQRHKMVRNALHSIMEQDYKNFHTVFIDDGSEPTTLSIAEEVLELPWEKHVDTFSKEDKWFTRSYPNTTIHCIIDSPEDKMNRGSRHPEGMNKAILESPGMKDTDVVVILCDDDALYPGYLSALNEYYKANPSVYYSYCHLAPWDPMIEKPDPSFASRGFWLNHGVDVPSAYCKCDSSQVTYRRLFFTQYGVRYPSPAFRALDAALYGQLQNFGPCKYNGIMGQYKGSFDNQLSYRISAETEYFPKDTEL